MLFVAMDKTAYHSEFGIQYHEKDKLHYDSVLFSHKNSLSIKVNLQIGVRDKISSDYLISVSDNGLINR